MPWRDENAEPIGITDASVAAFFGMKTRGGRYFEPNREELDGLHAKYNALMGRFTRQRIVARRAAVREKVEGTVEQDPSAQKTLVQLDANHAEWQRLRGEYRRNVFHAPPEDPSRLSPAGKKPS